MNEILVLFAVVGLHFAAAVGVALAGVKLYEYNPAAGLGLVLITVPLVVGAEYVVGEAIVWVPRNMFLDLVAGSAIAGVAGFVLVLFLADPEPQSIGSAEETGGEEDPFEELFDL
jgi:hypothetical protein